MGKVDEYIGAKQSPKQKLIDTVSGAIGKFYEPIHVKRMAKAKAKEIEVIGRALRENADIPIVYSKGEIVADTSDFDAFVKRAQNRMAFQELQKQQNIESVADKAYNLLLDETECSEEPVDNDWLSRFFNSVENISDNDMQVIWAKILAGEVKRPKTYSLRTLDTLRNLSKDEALLFQKIAPFVFYGDEFKYISSNSKLLEKYGINYGDIILLNECGLLNITSFMGLKISLIKEQMSEIIYSAERAVIFENKQAKDTVFDIDVYKLTTAGMELFDIVKKECNNDYILDLAEIIYIENKMNVYVKVFEIKSTENESIVYEDVPIKKFME